MIDTEATIRFGEAISGFTTALKESKRRFPDFLPYSAIGEINDGNCANLLGANPLNLFHDYVHYRSDPQIRSARADKLRQYESDGIVVSETGANEYGFALKPVADISGRLDYYGHPSNMLARISMIEFTENNRVI